MDDLYPTKTRLALLRDVADGEVWRYRDGQDYTGAGTKVTVRMAELEHAGWVRLERRINVRQWRMTDAGRAVLDGAA